MANCPKCSYVLVLLERRLKYKCALCSKLYPQKKIENKEFRDWNKQQKIRDIKNYEIEMKPKGIFERILEKLCTFCGGSSGQMY